MVRFIGNILTSHADADEHPEREVKRFHITPDEARSMDVTGLPVHLEHAGNVKVGEVTRSWDDEDGKKWVLANVDTSGIAGKYVRNDLVSGEPRYNGLSLQHMYREYSDGTSTKEPLEISICKEPRRPGCNIIHAATESPRYKMPCHEKGSSLMSSEQVTNEAVAEDPKPDVVSASVVAQPTPSTTQLMAEVVEASRQNDELQKKLEEQTAALAAVEEREATVKAESLRHQTEIATKLGDAVLEHVAKLDPELANEDTTKAINTLREKYPQEIARVMEVACCASKHAQKLEVELARSKEDNDRKLMEQAYHAAVATRPGCHGVSADMPVLETAVPASKRARLNPFAVHRDGGVGAVVAAAAPPHANMDTLQQIQEAYNGLKGTGSTVDAMKSVAGIIGQQREKGFR